MNKTRIKLENKLKKIQEEIKNFQSSCVHPEDKTIYCFSNINWPYVWTEYYCTECGKFWCKDGSVGIPNGIKIKYSKDLCKD